MKYIYLETVQMEVTAVIIVNVLNNRYASLRFEAVETGCGGYDLKVAHLHQPEVADSVILKLGADIAMIRDTIAETVRVKIRGKKEATEKEEG